MRKLRHVTTKAVFWATLAMATWRPAWRSDVPGVFSGARLETNCPQKPRATGENTSETKAENSSRGLASSWGNAMDASWQRQQLQQRNQRKSVRDRGCKNRSANLRKPGHEGPLKRRPLPTTRSIASRRQAAKRASQPKSVSQSASQPVGQAAKRARRPALRSRNSG